MARSEIYRRGKVFNINFLIDLQYFEQKLGTKLCRNIYVFVFFYVNLASKPHGLALAANFSLFDING